MRVEQVMGGTGTRKMEQVPGNMRNWYQKGETRSKGVNGGTGTRRVKQDPGRGWTWYNGGGTEYR